MAWSSTHAPQTAPDDGWEDVEAPVEEQRLARPPALTGETPTPATSGPPTIIEPAPAFAGDEDLAGRITAQIEAAPWTADMRARAAEAALPPELASPSTGFDDADSDASRATPAQRPSASADHDDIFDEPTDTGRGANPLARDEAPKTTDVAPSTVDTAAPSPTAATVVPAAAPSPTMAEPPLPARKSREGVDPRVAAGIHDTRTALDTEPLEDFQIDRFGFSRGAAVALFVAGFVAMLVVMLLLRRADGGAADAGGAALSGSHDAGAIVITDAGAVDAGPLLVDAGPPVDAGLLADAGLPDDAGADAVADAGAVDAVVDPAVDPAVDPEQAEYDLQLKRAENFSRRGDFGRSVRAYKAALALRRDSVTAHLGLGEAYYELDNLTAALLHLERARVLAPKDPQVYVLLGAAYQSAGRKSDAIRAYERHLALAPDGKTAYDVRAILRGLKN
jgi:hypothetical protein